MVKWWGKEIAIVDVETTGFSASKHEIVDIGLILVKRTTLEVVESWSSKVMPEHIETADPGALNVNGYNTIDWAGVPTLGETLKVFADKVPGAKLYSFNGAFDWTFLQAAFFKANMKWPMDEGCFCLLELSKLMLRNANLPNMKLKTVCEYLGIPPEPNKHEALNGAECAYGVLKKLAGSGHDIV